MKMDEEYQKKLVIAKFAYKQINEIMENIEISSGYDVEFCEWDHCLRISGDLFNSDEMTED
jgi:hypothetical protein